MFLPTSCCVSGLGNPSSGLQTEKINPPGFVIWGVLSSDGSIYFPMTTSTNTRMSIESSLESQI